VPFNESTMATILCVYCGITRVSQHSSEDSITILEPNNYHTSWSYSQVAADGVTGWL
jgi:hypothetical protein